MELNLVFNLEIRNMNLNDAIAKYIQKQKTASKKLKRLFKYHIYLFISVYEHNHCS